jgi:hypothetical protein
MTGQASDFSSGPRGARAILSRPVFITKTGFWLLLFAAFVLSACSSFSIPLLSPGTASLTTDRIKIVVRVGGWMRVSAESLRAAGLDLNSIDPTRVQVLDRDVVIPALASREGITFYAQASTTPFVAENVYILQWNQARGLTFAETSPSLSATPATTYTATLALEENSLYVPEAVETDRRLWQRLTAPAETTIHASLADRAPGDARAEIILWSFNQDPQIHPNHHVQLTWNQKVVGDVKWDGRTLYTMTVALPANVLRDGDNTIQLKLPGDTGAIADIVLLDRINILYPRKLSAVQDQLEFETDAPVLRVGNLSSNAASVYDITNPRAPVRISSAQVNGSAVTFATNANSLRRFLVLGQNAIPHQPLRLVPMSAMDLHRDSLRADEIIVTHPDFVEAVKPLVDWRKQHGVETLLVTTEQVYDEFGFGRADPAALRAFFMYAADHWNPAPRAVLLVGKASHDIYDYQRGPNKNLVPTHIQPTLSLGQAASDNWFVAASADDPHPRLAIGRIPAKSVEQVKTVVEKIRSYEAQSSAGWQKRAVFAADSKEPQFSASVDALAARLPSTVQAKKIQPAVAQAELAARRADILREWNAGALLMTYIGHGSIETWAAGPLLAAQDVANLSNRNALPILLTPTCLDGYFYDPFKDSLAEQVLFNPNGGIIAGVVPTGLSFPDAQDRLTDLLAREWFERHAATLGEALTRAKQQLPRDPGTDEVTETFVVLGDPMLKLPSP